MTLTMMSRICAEAFRRVQRFSSDWHANTFAGSTVRKITRGIWALDLLNDTLLLALLPTLIMLGGAAALLGAHWPVMGIVVGASALVYLVAIVMLSLGYVAPAARLGNAWDTKLGGALADAISCNAVVKAFGAETREEARLQRVIGKWRARTYRGWIRGTVNGSAQGGMLVLMRLAIVGVALLLWASQRASAGDIAFVLTMFFILQGYMRELGTHVAQPAAFGQRHGGTGRPGTPAPGNRGPSRRGAHRHRPPARSASTTSASCTGATPHPVQGLLRAHRAGRTRVGLVGHSGSGKTTFVKLIQRMHDVNEGAILIDGQDIATVQQASLRQQIAIVQQEPILFHRTLAENIAYGRPGATQAQIEAAARLANAHDFIATPAARRRRPWSANAASSCPAANASGWRSPRAFLADAPILILDEATSSLDSESEMLIQQAMERLMVGRTTLVVAHRLSTVRALDRLIVMEKGRIIEEGSHDALVSAPTASHRRLYERQALSLTSPTSGQTGMHAVGTI